MDTSSSTNGVLGVINTLVDHILKLALAVVEGLVCLGQSVAGGDNVSEVDLGVVPLSSLEIEKGGSVGRGGQGQKQHLEGVVVGDADLLPGLVVDQDSIDVDVLLDSSVEVQALFNGSGNIEGLEGSSVNEDSVVVRDIRENTGNSVGGEDTGLEGGGGQGSVEVVEGDVNSGIGIDSTDLDVSGGAVGEEVGEEALGGLGVVNTLFDEQALDGAGQPVLVPILGLEVAPDGLELGGSISFLADGVLREDGGVDGTNSDTGDDIPLGFAIWSILDETDDTTGFVGTLVTGSLDDKSLALFEGGR